MCINKLHGYKIQSINYAQDKTKIYRKKKNIKIKKITIIKEIQIK